METVWPKKANFFPTRIFFFDKHISIPIHCSICSAICFSISYLNSLILTKWEWNGKGIIPLVEKFLTEKIFNQKLSEALINSVLIIFMINMIIPSNSKMKWNRKKEERLVISGIYINAQNTAYVVSFQAFCFERLKYVQNFRLKHSRIQEISYI